MSTEYSIDDSIPRCIRVNQGERVLAEFYGHDAMENAKRFTATPELLDAVSKALNFCLNTQSEFGIPAGSEYELDTTKALRVAITKATGASRSGS